MLRSPLRPLLRPLLRSPTGLGSTTLTQKAIAILRKYGTNAHIFIPGVGTLSGITAGNYLDSAGTTAATVDNPVGLSLDALQAMTLGSEILTTTSAVITGTGNIAVDNSATVSVGKHISVTVTITGTFVGAIRLRTDATITKGTAIVDWTTPGTYQVNVLVTDPTAFHVYVNSWTSGTASIVCSVKQIPGIHATRATTANKPILRRGALNLLRQSQALATTPWAARVGTIVATNNFAVGLDGTTTATKLDKTGVVDAAWQQNIDTVMSASTPYTAVFILQKSVTTKIAEVAIRTVLGGIDRSSYVDCDTLSGATYVRVDTGTPAVTVSVADASTYWVIALNKTSASGASSDSDIIIRPYIGTTLGVFDDTATGSCVVYRAGLFQGTYTAQQILDAGGIPVTTTAAASNASAGKYSWQFDGSNDSLSLSAPLFQMSDDHCVIAGVGGNDKNNDVIFAQSSSTITRCPILYRPSGATAISATWVNDAGTTYACQSASGVTTSNLVATAVKRTNDKALRINGVQVASNATAPGAATVTAAAIGCLPIASSTAFFNGSIYPVIAIKGTVTDADLLTLERFVGQLSGVSL